MSRIALGFFFCLPGTLLSLQELPWLDSPYEFYLHSDATYKRYSSVDRAESPLPYPYNNYENSIGVAFVPMSNLEGEVEVEFARTPKQLYGFRSGAISLRYCVLDDITGDPLSLVIGTNVRGVAARAVKDISSPYASYMNYELFASAGREVSSKGDWDLRGYGICAFGLANHGSFWNRISAHLEGKIATSHIFSFFAKGYFGYGEEKTVDVERFRGWGYMDHSSVDLGIGYRYQFSLWGELGLSFSYRVLARSYPEREKSLQFSYTLPFSLF